MRKKGILKKFLGLAVVVSMLLDPIQILGLTSKTISAATYVDTYSDTIDNYTVPEWYRDAKFGIFIHYGVYSVPAFGDEWYGHWMYLPGTKSYGGSDIYNYNIKTYGSTAQGEGFGYKQFIPKFNTALQTYKKNNMAQSWADLFKKAGAKYVMPVGMHHDSFALYNSDVQATYNSVKQAGVDYVGDLQKAVKANGMKFGISNHFAENDWFFDESKAVAGSDLKATLTKPDELYGDGKSKSENHIKKWFNISMEIINKYNPDMIYYDFDLEQNVFNQYENANRYKMLAEFYQKAKTTNPDGVTCNYKGNAFLPSQAILDKERSALASINPIPWQTDTSIGRKSWGYTTDEVYRNANEFITAIIDITSKNGNLLLNVGPAADGTIPDNAKNTLMGIGDWLSKYGDAIYSTRPWLVYGEGPTKNSGDSYSYKEKDIRFTKSKDSKKLYATAMAKPTSNTLTITTLNSYEFDGSKIAAVKLINGEERETLSYTQDENGLQITLPSDYSTKLTSAYSVEITFNNNETIPSIGVLATEKVQTYNFSQIEGATVQPCAAFGTDMIASKSGTTGTVSYKLKLNDIRPDLFTGNFSGDSNGIVEFYVDGKNGTKVGEVKITPNENGGYRNITSKIDLWTLPDSTADLTIVLNGDIKFTWYRLLGRRLNEKIEAEVFDEKGGSLQVEDTKDTEGGGQNLGYVVSGDYAKYSKVNFGSGADEFVMRYGCAKTGGLEVRLDSIDGPIIVKPTDANTGSNTTYKTGTWELQTIDGNKVSGYHDIYVKFNSSLNLNWFMFQANNLIQPTDVTLSDNEIELDKGKTSQIAVKVMPENATEKALYYISSNLSVATVSSTGLIEAVAPGQATITVHTDNGVKATCNITVKDLIVQPIGISLVNSQVSLEKGKTSQIEVTFQPSNTTEKSVTYTSSNTAVATVSTTGLISAVAPGQAMITIQTNNGIKVSCNVTVTDTPVTKPIAATSKIEAKVKSYLGKNITLKKGKQIIIETSIFPKDAKQGVTFQSSNKSIVTVSGNGKLKAKGIGKARIIITSADGMKSLTYNIRVVAKEKVNKVLNIKSTVTVGVGKQHQIIIQKSTKDTTSQFSYVSSKKSVVTVSSYGVIKGIKAGSAIVTVKCGKKSAKTKVVVK